MTAIVACSFQNVHTVYLGSVCGVSPCGTAALCEPGLTRLDIEEAKTASRDEISNVHADNSDAVH